MNIQKRLKGSYKRNTHLYLSNSNTIKLLPLVNMNSDCFKELNKKCK